jgi:hypothetical protein
MRPDRNSYDRAIHGALKKVVDGFVPGAKVAEGVARVPRKNNVLFCDEFVNRGMPLSTVFLGNRHGFIDEALMKLEKHSLNRLAILGLMGWPGAEPRTTRRPARTKSPPSEAGALY